MLYQRLLCSRFYEHLLLFDSMCEQVRGDNDDSDDGKVSYLPFLQRLGVTIKPGDIEGLSTQIHQSSEHRERVRQAGLNIR